MADSQDEASFATRRDHLPRRRRVESQRLLAEDVFAGPCGCENLGGVEPVGRRDQDPIDVATNYLTEQGLIGG